MIVFNDNCIKKGALHQRAIYQARILLGLSGSGLSGEGKTENVLLLAERFATLLLIGVLTHLLHGDVTMEGKNVLLPKQADISAVFSPKTLH